MLAIFCDSSQVVM